MATVTKDWSKVAIPQSYADLMRDYGNPESPTFEADYIVENDHQIADGSTIHVRSHVAMAPALHAIFADGGGHYIKDYGGCYVVRNVRGMSTKSIHSWGLAIDVNVTDNPLGAITPNQPAPLVALFKSHGFFWGADYHSRKDPMHFQRAGDF